MTGTSAAVQATCRRSAYRPFRTAGRKAEYGRFSVLPRPEIYRNLRIKDSVKIDPCCGSGHILVYVFDLLYRMYEEKGYTRREIPTLILKNNLVGLDVDKRAAQLASFALVMKARKANNRFFNEDYYTVPQVHELRDAHFLERIGYRQHLAALSAFTDEEIRAVTKLVDTFRYGKTVGSLIKVPVLDVDSINKVIHYLENDAVLTVENTEFMQHGVPLLKALLTQAQAMSVKYDAMITNPPYLGTSSMEPSVKDYAVKNYPNSKADLFAMFMETGFVRQYGFTAMINMHAWMFLSTYEKLRIAILASKMIVSMAHLGARAFETIAGEVVQTTCFVLRQNVSGGYIGAYSQLLEYGTQEEKEKAFMTRKHIFVKNQNAYSFIPGSPIAYWVSEATFNNFGGPKLGEKVETRCGMSTSDNDRFLRFWYEPAYGKIGFGYCTLQSANTSEKKWFPYNKGGEYRKWYGNRSYVVNWEEDGKEIKYWVTHNPSDPNTKTWSRRIFGTDRFFKKQISWSDISSGHLSFRLYDEGFIFDASANSIFCAEESVESVLAFLNTKIVNYWATILNPTIHFKTGNLENIPYREIFDSNIVEISVQCLLMCHSDWDAFETSWDFKVHPLVELCPGYAWGDNEPTRLISAAYNAWERLCEGRFQQLKANEEELNRIFIDIYGLQNELTPEVKDEDVTVRLADKERDIKSLISYLVGLIMGRYSLDVEGLAYAGGDWDASKYRRYQPDDDGIVPIYAGLGMEDGLTARVIRLIKLIYGANSYRQNIDFIAEALGKKSSESSEETLNRYLNDGFYADHLKIYQKRPIYWLFSSGKHSGFKCLIYMHRYNADTLARINGKYFLPESARLKNELDELLLRINRAEGRDRVRLEKERQKLAAAYNEALEYGQVLDHMANKYIAIDLDDGVKDNYAKFQSVELVTDSGTKVKKDLLSPIK